MIKYLFPFEKLEMHQEPLGVWSYPFLALGFAISFGICLPRGM
jgi:hypothetical protein